MEYKIYETTVSFSKFAGKTTKQKQFARKSVHSDNKMRGNGERGNEVKISWSSTKVLFLQTE